MKTKMKTKNIIILLLMVICSFTFSNKPIKNDNWNNIIKKHSIDFKDSISISDYHIVGNNEGDGIYTDATMITIDGNKYNMYSAKKIIYNKLKKTIEIPLCNIYTYKTNSDIIRIDENAKFENFLNKKEGIYFKIDLVKNESVMKEIR